MVVGGGLGTLPASGTEALHWLLWTKEAAAPLEEASAVLAGYSCRWPIEDYHLTIKSGCQIERLQLQSWEGLQKALVLYAAVAARVVQLRDSARQEPEAPARQLLSEEECLVLRGHCDRDNKLVGELTLGQAVLWIGKLGGHLNRKGDGMPGVQPCGRGCRRLGPPRGGLSHTSPTADRQGGEDAQPDPDQPRRKPAAARDPHRLNERRAAAAAEPAADRQPTSGRIRKR